MTSKENNEETIEFLEKYKYSILELLKKLKIRRFLIKNLVKLNW